MILVAASCAVASLLAAACTSATAQEMGELSAIEGDAFESGAPLTESGGGDFFSQELGTLLRLRYNTESYGQDRRGNFDIGTMQVANFADAIGFFDGQVTVSDVNGVGYNLGLGVRWLGWTPFPLEPERITGFNVWADGSSTESGNFFPQVGVGFESLGNMWDLRVNGYIPIGQESQLGEFSPTGAITFDENFLVLEAIADRNTSFNVGEAEIARRIMADRDAWAFAGPYVLVNEDQDAAGYRVGMRGYAYPDLLLQVAVSDDDIFKTNAAFQVTWFVGRTRNNFQPACGLPDRMREPVMRNDYVALQRTKEVGGEALNGTDGSPLRFVHVNSASPDGGDGTFENPLNNVGNVEDNSQISDIVLLYSNSVFSNQNTLVSQDNQRLLGEGNGEFFTVTTQQEGVVVIPETSPGARDGARPIIMDTLGAGAVRLADANEVANFNINGSAGAGIFSPATGAGNPNIHDLNISNTTGDGIQFTPLSRVDEDNPALITVAGNVTIDDVIFDNVGGNDIDINSLTAENINDPNVTLQEVISITDVTTTDGNNFSLNLSNTHAGTGRSTTIARFNYDGGTTGGGMRLSDYNGTLNMSASTFTNGSDLLAAVQIGGVSDGTITLANTVTFDSVEGTVIDVGPVGTDVFNGSLTVNGDITNHSSGRLVSIQGLGDSTATVTLAGDMTDVANMDSTGIRIADNDDGTILFTGDLTVNTMGDDRIGIELDTNDSTDISFNGLVDVTTNGQDSHAFDAHDGGTLTVLGTTNTLTSAGGSGLRIVDMTISTAAVKFAEINVSAGAMPVTTPVNGIYLEDNTGGAITLGILTDPVGDSGTIEDTSGSAIVIDNSENVTISGMIVNATAGQTGVEITKNTTGTQITNLNNLEVNDGDVGIEVIGNGTGTLNLTVNDTDVKTSTATGISVDNIDTGTIGFNNVTVDGEGAAATAGISITNSDANFTIDGDSSILGVSGTDFNVNGGTTGTISMQGDITNTAGRSIAVQNRTGGTVTFTSTSAVTDSGAGILVNGNTGGTTNFQGTYDLDTVANDAVTITNNTGATISFTPPSAAGSFDIDTTTGDGFVATGGGTLTVAGTGNTITTTTGRGLNIEGMTIGAVDFESVNVNGADNGIRLVNNITGAITVGDTGAAAGAGGTIQNTTNAGVHVENSNVTLNGVTVQNAGDTNNENGVDILHTNAITMNANLNRLTVTNATALRDGVVINGTGGTGTFNANIQNLNVNVTGDGLVVDEGVTLTAGGTNTITSDTGVGLTVTDSAIAAAGANFQSVNVTNGSTNGIVLQNLTGTGTLSVTGMGTTDGSGGTLDTTGDAIVVTNAANVSLNNIDVVGSANAVAITKSNTATMTTTLTNVDVTGATNDGVNVNVTTSGVFDLTINDSDISGVGNEGFELTGGGTATDVDVVIDQMTTSENLLVNTTNNTALDFRLTNSTINANTAMNINSSGNFDLLVENSALDSATGNTFDLALGANAQDADIIIRNNATFEAGDGKALEMTAIGTNINVDLLITANTFANASAASETADIFVMGGALVDANITSNSFANSLAADEFAMESDGSTTRINLNLVNNTTTGVYELTTTNQGVPGVDFNFGVVDRDDADANNIGTVNFNPIITDFEDIAGPIDPPVLP